MSVDRRKFLQGAVGAISGTIARTLGLGVATGAAAAAPVAAAAAATGAAVGAFRPRVRNQVFEVIVRQAMAGAPWKEICALPMKVNAISEAEVEAEIARRQQHNDSGSCSCADCTLTHYDSPLCRCPACRQQLHNHYRRVFKAIQNIPHTNEPACACADCRQKVRDKLRQIEEALEA